MCVNDMCVCDKIDWMENGWMDWIEWMWKVDVESGKWIVESGKWRGSGSHTRLGSRHRGAGCWVREGVAPSRCEGPGYHPRKILENSDAKSCILVTT